MTLNVTVLTPSIIYQSADFRITNLETGELITDRSPKSVALISFSWNGFVTYTGLGLWRDGDVSNNIVRWLTGQANFSMEQVAQILETKGTALLRDFEQFHPRTRHTFILAGFEDGKARVYIISNCEDCFGGTRSADDRLTMTSRTLSSRRKATVIVTGRKAAVTTSDRRALKNVASRYPGDGLRLRRRMAELNKAAAGSSQSRGLISEECVVLSFTSDGRGAMHFNRDEAEIPMQFPTIMNGINLHQMMMENLKNLGVDVSKVRMGAFASATSHPGNRAAPTAPCRPIITIPDKSCGYQLNEITSNDFEPESARDINDHGQVVGTGRSGPGSYPNIPWVHKDGHTSRLNYAGLATAVSNTGLVAAVLQTPGRQRAACYENDVLTELPLYHGEAGVFAGSDSEASAVNSHRAIAGSVRSQDEEPGLSCGNVRAAIFHPGKPTIALDGIPPEHQCRTLDINNRGHVLALSIPRHFDARCILWDPASATWSHVGDDTHNVFPIALADDDTVLGQARNAQNQPVAVICKSGGRWEPLGTPDGWQAVNMNNRGEVVGRALIDRLYMPWLRRPDGEIVMLPYMLEHNTIPVAINNVGQITGNTQADHGGHAVLWYR